MKTILMSFAGAFALGGFMTFENNNTSREVTRQAQDEVIYCMIEDTVPSKSIYRDLNTGETIDIWYDAVGMRTLNKKTGAPVEFYINTSTNDTVFGRGRFVVNNYVLKGDDGKWKLNDGKVKVDGDELKVKVGDQKLKIDGDEIKIKGNGVKAKSEDGEVKVKTKDGKAKYEDDKTKVKTKDSTRNEQ
jgi:hypothetical protein